MSRVTIASPTASPRKVFSSPAWSVDHETITVANDGGPITVLAWVDSPSNNATIPVEAAVTRVISTPSILIQDGQILNVGFDAYDNGVRIDTYKATIHVDSTTKSQSPGFAALLGLICLLGVAYLVVRKGR